MSKKPSDNPLAFRMNNFFPMAFSKPIKEVPSLTASPSQNSPPSNVKNGIEQQMELLKDLKIRGGASRNLLFTKTEHPKKFGEKVERREVYLDDKVTSTKTKATTELNSGQEASTQIQMPPPKKIPVPAGLAVFSPRNYLYRIGIQKTNRMLFQALNCSTKDCIICNRNKGLRQFVSDNLNKKYLPSKDTYNAKVISDIVYNENVHIVTVFKDYLIYDDVTEFLKRSYAHTESTQRLSKILDYYHKYSKVFPNYAVIQERKYMFYNIERKQRAIDEKYRQMHEMKKKKPNVDESVENKIFTTGFLQDLNKTDSILGRSMDNDSFGEDSFFKRTVDTQMQYYIKSQESIRKNGKYEKSCFESTMNLQELVEKFIMKDSQSFVQTNEPATTNKGQCAIQIKKADNTKRKVLEIAIGSKKVVLQHIPVLDKIKEKVKHVRTKSHNNVSTQPNPNASLKAMEPRELFPFSCKHADAPANIARPVSTSRNTEAWTSVKSNCKADRGGTTIQHGFQQKSLIKTITPSCIANDIRSKSHGKFVNGETRKKSTGRQSQASARATPRSKKSAEREPRKVSKKIAANASMKELTIKSPTNTAEVKKSEGGKRENSEKRTKIKLALQIPSTARASSAMKLGGETTARNIAPQLNANLMLSLGIRSPSAATVVHNAINGHFRAATIAGLPKNEPKQEQKNEQKRKTKVLAIDVEEANKNMNIGLETKTFTNIAGTCKNPKGMKYNNNRTPDPSHRRFKSSYLNTLNAKVLSQLEENRKMENPIDVLAQTPSAALLIPSKSTGNLRKSGEKSGTKSGPRRRRTESIHEAPQERSEKKVVKRAEPRRPAVNKMRHRQSVKDLQI